ncbi:hypothetical protein B0H10DRAFT_2224115 [Mycena sp. CBHHK59/15]|nr:hypothetical protein B0H10DRAFT_2224115 [Mycena sp. CBHHK59/15]
MTTPSWQATPSHTVFEQRWGGDGRGREHQGSTVVTASGESLTYNSLGGIRAGEQLDVLLNETWGGARTRYTEISVAVITPAFFQAYPSAQDQWTLAALMRTRAHSVLGH